jgi:hypothetical protein
MRLIESVRPTCGRSYLGESERYSCLPEDDADEYGPSGLYDTWLIWRCAGQADGSTWRSGCCLVLPSAANVTYVDLEELIVEEEVGLMSQ